MQEKFHYENNLFFLSGMVRTLHEAIRLTIDADLFAAPILDDSLFLDSAIQKIHEQLRENPHLVPRQQYLHKLMKVRRAYILFLNDLLASDHIISQLSSSDQEMLFRIASAHAESNQVIRQELQNTPEDDNMGSQEIISHDELNILLADIDEPDEELAVEEA